MVDNLKKKKQDLRRISLTQKHEVQYLLKIAREQLELLNKVDGRKSGFIGHIDHGKGKWEWVKFSKPKISRCLKALIKCLERRKK